MKNKRINRLRRAKTVNRKTGYATKHNNYKAKHPEIYGCKFRRRPTVKKEKRINSAIHDLIGELEISLEYKSVEEQIADLLS